jgi:hypothetical protein
MTIPESEIALRIEIRGIYDGTSVFKLKDGSYVNRWDEGDPRHGPTQAWIDGVVGGVND